MSPSKHHDFPEFFYCECEKTRLPHERIPKHPRQDVESATRTYAPNPKSLDIFSRTPINLQQDSSLGKLPPGLITIQLSVPVRLGTRCGKMRGGEVGQSLQVGGGGF